jgi:hypothetical protein
VQQCARAAQIADIHSSVKEFVDNTYLPFYQRSSEQGPGACRADDESRGTKRAG